jgi:hypothetical protein
VHKKFEVVDNGRFAALFKIEIFQQKNKNNLPVKNVCVNLQRQNDGVP